MAFTLSSIWYLFCTQVHKCICFKQRIFSRQHKESSQSFARPLSSSLQPDNYASCRQENEAKIIHIFIFDTKSMTHLCRPRHIWRFATSMWSSSRSPHSMSFICENRVLMALLAFDSMRPIQYTLCMPRVFCCKKKTIFFSYSKARILMLLPPKGKHSSVSAIEFSQMVMIISTYGTKQAMVIDVYGKKAVQLRNDTFDFMSLWTIKRERPIGKPNSRFVSLITSFVSDGSLNYSSSNIKNIIWTSWTLIHSRSK